MSDADALREQYLTLLAEHGMLRPDTADAEAAHIVAENTELRTITDIVESTTVCPVCGSNKTTSIGKQVRSGDEGATQFNHCMICGHNWTTH